MGKGRSGFSLVELLAVIAILAVITGMGASGFKGWRNWLAARETGQLFLELETACRLYRMEHGAWPPAFAGGEADLSAAGGADWRSALAPYLERPVIDRVLTDGFGNTRILLLVDTDGDHWIRADDFNALAADARPQRLWGRVAVYSLDGEGGLAARSWSDEGD